MSGTKDFFRNVVDALIESRSRQAAREVAQYRHLDMAPAKASKR